MLTYISFNFLPFAVIQQKHVLTAEKRFISSLILCLKQQAIITQEPQHIYLDLEKKSYRYSQAGVTQNRTLPANITFTPQKSIVPLSGKKLRLCTFPQKNNSNVITCYPTGSISPGTLYLGMNNNWYALRIEVKKDAIIRWYQYTQKQWALIQPKLTQAL